MSQFLPGNRRPNNAPSNWKAKAFVIGIIGGIVLGVLGAYMYTRAAEDDASNSGQAARIQTGDLLGLGLALLGVMRQVAELGRGPEPARQKKR